MLTDTTRAVRDVCRAEKIFVITNYRPAMEIAEENGWEILREDRQISESDSVDAASRRCAQRGVRSLLRLPLDLPLLQPSDIDELLAIEYPPPAMAIVPSRDGTGTNALLRTPPRSEEHTSELQSRLHLVCRLLLEKKNHIDKPARIHAAVHSRHHALR